LRGGYVSKTGVAAKGIASLPDACASPAAAADGISGGRSWDNGAP